MIVVAVAFIGFAVWAYLLLLHPSFARGFWRANQRLPAETAQLEHWPSVIAAVPARNEAETIGEVIAALRAQDYRGAFRIVVVDDHSTDGTAEIAGTAAGTIPVEVVAAPMLEPGWTGKLWALNAGIGAADGDGPQYFWFTDADIVHPPLTLTRLVSKAITGRRDLVSLMVRLRCKSFWECRLIPAFVFFFQMLYPFALANDPRSRVAAAAGGCVLLSRQVLRQAGGIAAIRGHLIDDCALAGAVKRAGGKIWLGLADGGQSTASHSLRAADTLAPLWTMVRRTAFTQLGYSRFLLATTVLGLGLIFLGPPFVVLTAPWHGRGLSTLAGLLAWGGMSLAYIPTLRDYGRSAWESLLLPSAAALYAAMTLDSALAHWRRRGGQWKGRNYGPSSGPGNLSEFP